jgi:hypothetical protein
MAGHTVAWQPTQLAHPWFAGVADLVDRVAHEPDWPAVERLDAYLRDELAAVGMRLVEAPKGRPALLADGTIDPASLYEVRIVERGEIPTRPRNAHDLLNALIWAAFPHSKLALSRALAAIQRERAAGRTRLPPTRTRAHDRLALVDEGALFCVAGARRHRWIFGHAILEHAYAGELAVRATAVDIEVPGIDVLEHRAARAAVDRAVASADLASAVRGGPGIPIELSP